MTKNVHPEGLPVEPEGQGWTMPEPARAQGTRTNVPFLLNDYNIHSIRSKEPTAFEAAVFAIKSLVPAAVRDPRTGLTRSGWDDREIERLAALSIFVAKGVVPE